MYKYIQKLEKEGDINRQYEIADLIGQGNFSSVYLVVRKLDEKEFALKKIYKKELNGAQYLVENEVEILRRILHKNICHLFGAYESKRSYFLLFEYVERGDLFETLSAVGTLEENLSSKIIAQAAAALSYLHEQQIVHRDVKPENLLLTTDFLVKLTDFGLACSAKKPLYRICGTPSYIAPEILKRTGYGVAVDVWSLGIILYQMLLGHTPFKCSSRYRLFRMIMNADLTFLGSEWSNISEGAVSLLSKMLITDTTKRYTASQILSHHWFTMFVKKPLCL
ncbi:unnamed protein product [Enterobius vermicularis]|uniref:Protein kinase domain-containing protein n=1 Tax=Enterobius vermicularis TaxID=51028 RepID=A0A0N4VD07_ENTVE|nr:unnamed protein product [Enterobius vermicularis]